MRQGREEVNLELLFGQFCKLTGKMLICEFLHVTLIVAGDFLALDASVEKVAIEFAHHSEARALKVAILLHKLRFLARVEREL